MNQASRERIARLALLLIDGLGPVTFWKLIRRYGSALATMKATPEQLKEIVRQQLVVSITLSDQIEKASMVLKAHEDAGIQVLMPGLDDNFPELLLALHPVPPVLYVKGEMMPEDNRSIAVVGTRQPTHYGITVTTNLVEALVANRVTIVSGLAMGIDRIAHETALQGGGRTLAVLGHGLEQIHPRIHANLAHQMLSLKQGVLLSTFPMGSVVRRANFAIRNQLVAGLSHGVLVTEGAMKSGTKITAQAAIKQGKPVFAVPGPITSQMSQAPVALLKQGACLVTSGQDVLNQLGWQTDIRPKTRKDIKLQDPLQEAIWNLLQKEAVTSDEMVRLLTQSTAEISMALTYLEMEGLIIKRDDLWFIA